ncbi:MAG: 23S rRNA (uridine(2552)-2'-O)-methyltransferase RlmE [Coxiella sp. (in: Bacteria)]|nr:MAG: 23S rRNA (uridine(2552)-2'-O)-methyltransferase RlmE [Coxiella sp. (in: g-proteobacteria)]
MSSKRWLHEHHNDVYVKRSREEGYASRAAYKLLELNDKDHFLKPGMTVVDLGSTPGGWSQVASKLIGHKGRVFALDLLPMDPIPGVTFLQGDFTESQVLDKLMAMIDGDAVDLVISDMAPNLSGNKGADQPRSVYLVELALDCAYNLLKKNGSFLAKIFQGEGVDVLIADMRKRFKTVRIRKPKASRARSSEIYIFATGFMGYND